MVSNGYQSSQNIIHSIQSSTSKKYYDILNKKHIHTQQQESNKKRTTNKQTNKMKYIKDMGEWTALMETSKSKLVVVDFTASWCGPCKMISPIFEKLAEENPEAEFVKVDVDDAEDVAAHCSIQAMPTFHFYKGGVKVTEMMGADQQKLKDLVASNK